VRLNLKNKMSAKARLRLKKKVRIRKKIFGTSECPRLSVFRSARHIYAQVVDDSTGVTLAEASTRTAKISGSTGSRDAAKAIGLELAKRAKDKNVTRVVFDRNGFQYHGRIQSLADGAREGGLGF
jgi:large subunit ribosomal protein L18